LVLYQSVPTALLNVGVQAKVVGMRSTILWIFAKNKMRFKEKNKTFITLKFSVIVLICLSLSWSCSNKGKTNPEGFLSDRAVTQQNSSLPVTTNENTKEERVTLRLEEQSPDKPFSSRTVAAYKNNVLLFKCNLPEGEILLRSDSLIQVSLPEKTGTNLLEETFCISVSTGKCDLGDEQIDWSKLRIHTINFNKGILNDGGAGHVYTTYYYSWEHINGCTSFLLNLTSGIPEAADPPLKKFNEKEEVEKAETILKTIVVEPG
jgi:hypothetical protein